MISITNNDIGLTVGDLVAYHAEFFKYGFKRVYM